MGYGSSCLVIGLIDDDRKHSLLPFFIVMRNTPSGLKIRFLWEKMAAKF